MKAQKQGELNYAPPAAYKIYKEELADSLKLSLHASQEDMQWWKDAQYGMFICWTAASVMELGPMGWARFGPRPGHPKKAIKGVPAKIYDSLYTKFNPDHFNAGEWVKLVRESGARYLIFLTKHHDGFCMFNSKVTDYDIMNTPYGKDVCKEIADECHKQGVKLFWYYSQPDWHHPDYFTDRHEHYIDYMHAQVTELLTNYGKIDGMWFDGLGKHPDQWLTPVLLKKIRDLQPGIIINHRIGPRDWRMGDFDGPEREIGHFQVNHPWETCTTIGGTWGWGGDVDPMAFNSVVKLLVQCAGNGGNLALNTGPAPNGKINPKHEQRYQELGDWLRKYGKSIYATEAGPYIGGPWGVCTQKNGKIHLHILASWQGGQLTFPALLVKVKAARLLTGGEMSYEQDENSLSVNIPAESVDPLNTIVELDIDEQSGFIHPILTMPEDNITFNAEVIVSSGEESAANIVAGDKLEFAEGAFVKSTWKPSAKDHEPWVILKLKELSSFNQIMLSAKNAAGQVFDIEMRDGNGSWFIISRGNTLNEFNGFVLDELKTCNQIRIKFKEVKNRIQLRSVNLYKSLSR